MKRSFRNILIGVCGALLVACMAIAFTAGAHSRKSLRCTGLKVVVLDSMENSFVSKGDVKGYLDREYGKYVGEVIDSIDLTRIEDIIDGRSAVMKSQAYVTRDGKLHVDVSQRKPVVRFQKSDGGFYADAEGYIFPLQRSYASHVQIIDGNIPLAANSGYKGAIEDPKEKVWFENMMRVVNYIENSRTWKDKIVQISVDEGKDLILIPREGNERFLFGQPVDIEDKFRKMEKYYTHIIPAKGEGYYRTVDLKYKGQIVCKEK
jgi:cell division protein FtsQ